MRLSRFEISNYKAIRHASMDRLSDEPAIVISGKNGTGKSLLLEGILATWTGYRVGEIPEECVGPWGDDARIEVEFSLTASEREAAAEWNRQYNNGDTEFPPTVSRVRTWNRFQGAGHNSTSAGVSILTDHRFGRSYGFATVDHIPPNRNISAGRSSLSVDLGIFAETRLEEERKNHLENVLRWRGAYSAGDVLTYLATVDYLDQIVSRTGGEPTNEFDLLASNFLAATGKEIRKPEVDVNSGVSIKVHTPYGQDHEISDLSVGEHEVLNLMYFVRRLSARGGILLLDEPEQHLHPTLQAALFETMANMADRAQVIAVSHSPSLIAAVSPSAVLDMTTPRGEGDVQLRRVSEDQHRVELLSELGLRPSALVQSDALIVVEGNSDEAALQSLFPIELSRCRFVVAGSVAEVMHACRSLEELTHVIPWLCVRDRDLLDEDEYSMLTSSHSNLHIWNRRMLENELLDLDLIRETFLRAGMTKTVDEIRRDLRSVADSNRDEVLVQLVQARLSQISVEVESDQGDKFDKLRAYYSARVEANQQRVDSFDSVLSTMRDDLDQRWDDEWISLAHGKTLMAGLARFSPFATMDALVSALAATYAQGFRNVSSLNAFNEKVRSILYPTDSTEGVESSTS